MNTKMMDHHPDWLSSFLNSTSDEFKPVNLTANDFDALMANYTYEEVYLAGSNVSIPDDLEALLFNKTTLSNISGSIAKSWKSLSIDEKERYLLQIHGPKQLETNWAVGMTTFYAFLFLLGVPGNFLTCLIIFMNSYMWASPNYFLFNLAVTDIITLVIGKMQSPLATFFKEADLFFYSDAHGDFSIVEPISMAIWGFRMRFIYAHQ